MPTSCFVSSGSDANKASMVMIEALVIYRFSRMAGVQY
jgi:hypothetical protein